MSNLAIIPARVGSKRIPLKNIREFLGKPIIAYSIEIALECGLFDEIMVSTDNKEIADISIEYGASVPFLRSKKNSDDFASTADVLVEVIEEYKSRGKDFKTGCCIYATNPLLNKEKLSEAYELLKLSDYDTVFPISEFSYPILRSFHIEGDQVKMNWPEYQRARSQDLNKSYHDAGQFYWFQVSRFLSNRELFTSNSGAIVLSELEVQDIDTELDWKLAEIKAQLSG